MEILTNMKKFTATRPPSTTRSQKTVQNWLKTVQNWLKK